VNANTSQPAVTRVPRSTLFGHTQGSIGGGVCGRGQEREEEGHGLPVAV
jgi:hypothetical protein